MWLKKGARKNIVYNFRSEIRLIFVNFYDEFQPVAYWRAKLSTIVDDYCKIWKVLTLYLQTPSSRQSCSRFEASSFAAYTCAHSMIIFVHSDTILIPFEKIIRVYYSNYMFIIIENAYFYNCMATAEISARIN